MATAVAAKRRVHPVDQVPPVPKLAPTDCSTSWPSTPARCWCRSWWPAGWAYAGDQLIHLINADLFTCGIASIIQSVGFWKIGVRLPLLQGVTFAGVAPMIAIGVASGAAPRVW